MKKLDKNFFVDRGESEVNHPIKDFLKEDETILWKSKPKKMAYVLGRSLAIMPIGLIWGILDGFAIGAIISQMLNGNIPILMLLFFIPFFSIHLFPFWMWLRAVIKSAADSRTVEYVITNERILIFKGNPRYIFDSLSITSLVDAQLKINLIDRILCVGDITIVSNSGKSIQITDVPKSKFLHKKIMDICMNNSSSGDLILDEFYNNRVECSHCGSFYDSDEPRCPSCGSTKKTK